MIPYLKEVCRVLIDSLHTYLSMRTAQRWKRGSTEVIIVWITRYDLGYDSNYNCEEKYQ